MPLIYDLLTRNLAGEAIGLPCFCTANEQVIRAVLSYAADTGFPTVIEATCNQVNQEGGYSGMQPSDFMAWVLELAAKKGVPADQLIFGGDHLGPNPWKSEPLETAMEKARELVMLYVEAGFTKIHLDASMACGGEPNPSFAQIAERAADLCAVAEAHAPDPERLIYIIGTEVPIPGGEQEEPDALDVTSVPRLQDTIQTHREAWDKRGLDKAWGRIVSVVTQPGVDFGHTSIYPFIPEKAAPLAEAIRVEQRLSYEAHSTDYQAKKALTQLVEKHFFFLKVGPELTYRFREAVWALAEIEELLLPSQTSRVRETVLETMADEPNNWKSYYHGSEREIEILKRFSYSDRIRYYWTIPKVQSALKTMIESLNQQDLPETMISQAFTGLDFGTIPKDPQMLIEMHIQRCIERYFEAAGFSKAQG